VNSDQLKGKWKQLKGSVKERWGKLTDDDLEMISGQQEQLLGKIQERYGIAREDAEQQVEECYAVFVQPAEPKPQRTEQQQQQHKKAS
jgi:uncharacterized protein YjbJ (UPF0337 family)